MALVLLGADVFVDEVLVPGLLGNPLPEVLALEPDGVADRDDDDDGPFGTASELFPFFTG